MEKKITEIRGIEMQKTVCLSTKDQLFPSRIIPDKLYPGFGDVELCKIFSRPVNYEAIEAGRNIEVNFHFYFSSQKKENKTSSNKVAWKFEFPNKHDFIGLNDVLGAATELLITEGLDCLYSGELLDSIYIFGVVRRIQDTSLSLAKFPSVACMWLGLGILYLLKHNEGSVQCFVNAKEAFGKAREALPQVASDFDNLIKFIDYENKTKLNCIIDQVSDIFFKISSFPETITDQHKKLLVEINRTLTKTMPEVDNKARDKLIGSLKEYEVWENLKGARFLSREELQAVKKDKNITLLLDETGRIYSKGIDKTEFFRQKKVSYSLARYFLANRGSAFLDDVLMEYKRAKRGKPVAKRSLIRAIRALNSLFKNEKIRIEIFFTNKDRLYISNDARVCAIKEKQI